jgi:hypothetical protein
MSDELFDDILLQADALGIKQILIFLNGEPFVFSRFFDWLEKLRGYGMKTHVFTNAAAMSPEKSEKLVSYADVAELVCFSVSGMDTQSQRDIMNLPMGRVIRNIRHFIDINTNKIPFWVSMPDVGGKGYQKKWKAFWSDIVGSKRCQVNPMFNWGGKVTHAKKGNLTSFCNRLNHMTVLWDGRVSLCCMDGHGDVILGDLNHETIDEVYNGELAKHYRSKHRSGQQRDLKLCDVCNMR